MTILYSILHSLFYTLYSILYSIVYSILHTPYLIFYSILLTPILYSYSILLLHTPYSSSKESKDAIGPYGPLVILYIITIYIMGATPVEALKISYPDMGWGKCYSEEYSHLWTDESGHVYEYCDYGEIDITKAVIHHTASHDVSAWTIDRWHKERGWDGIGYHFIIRKDGSIEEGRPLNKKGAHAVGRNTWVGIALTGYDVFTEEQKYSLKQLLRKLGTKYLERHHEFCPGRGLDLREFIR